MKWQDGTSIKEQRPMLPNLMYGMTQNLERHFAKLGTIGIQPDGSISRIAFSDAESTAMAYIRAEGEAFGLQGRYDGIGNLILSLRGDYSQRLLVGSHLDTVPNAGNFDGSAGIVAALEALREIVEEKTPLHTGIDLVAWRGEEYTFNAVYKGSASAFGDSEPHILRNLYGNQSLRQAILQQGFDPSYIDECRSSLEQDYIDSITGYFELHIEQGARLEMERKDLGIVTSISGDRRFLVVLEGRFDHSGGTPMGVQYRSDVNLAMAYMQTRINELSNKRYREGNHFVQTVGIINTDPEINKKYPDIHSNSVTKVSGLAYFTLDIMSCDDDFMDNYSGEVHRVIWQTANEFGVKAFIEQTDVTYGLNALDSHIQKCLENSSGKLGYSYLRMPSGAGHDTVAVAKAKRSDGSHIPVGMLFVPCKGGVSHSKDEYSSPEQLRKGAETLRDTMIALCGKEKTD